ncbi:MAG: CtsR family transcriptional regulator [Limnochordia bacterium]|jgi:transcriptional regulator CtsR
MATLADLIEAYLKRLIHSQAGFVEIRRGDLADSFSCAPSQINYVLETRFRAEHGYLVESKRGGGGYIRIRRVVIKPEEGLYHTICECIGEQISKAEADRLLSLLVEHHRLPLEQVRKIARFLHVEVDGLPLPWRDVLRAVVLKGMLLLMLGNEPNEDGGEDDDVR